MGGCRPSHPAGFFANEGYRWAATDHTALYVSADTKLKTTSFGIRIFDESIKLQTTGFEVSLQPSEKQTAPPAPRSKTKRKKRFKKRVVKASKNGEDLKPTSTDSVESVSMLARQLEVLALD